MCQGHRATIVGTHGNDVIVGTSHADVIAALSGNDVVHGEGGNDIICGNDGADVLWGGAGNDQLFGGRDDVFYGVHGRESHGDLLVGGLGDDRLVGNYDARGFQVPGCVCSRDVLSWHDARHGLSIDVATGSAVAPGADGTGHDVFDGRHVEIDGSQKGDFINGGPWADVIRAGGGGDSVLANDGDDWVWADGPTVTNNDEDSVIGGPGNDHVFVSFGQDVVTGGLGNDTIEDDGSGRSIDQFFGGAGNDTIKATIVRTIFAQGLLGQAGDDTVTVRAATDQQGAVPASWNMATGAMSIGSVNPFTVTVANFEHAVLASPLDWSVQGSDKAETLVATSTARADFAALGGDDTFTGSPGNDTFNGGPGTDHSLGMGDGDDTCISVEILDKSDCEHVTP
jgi:Ca2+-binding RTX toxin-like protein